MFGGDGGRVGWCPKSSPQEVPDSPEGLEGATRPSVGDSSSTACRCCMNHSDCPLPPRFRLLGRAFTDWLRAGMTKSYVIRSEGAQDIKSDNQKGLLIIHGFLCESSTSQVLPRCSYLSRVVSSSRSLINGHIGLGIAQNGDGPNTVATGCCLGTRLHEIRPLSNMIGACSESLGISHV